MATTLLLPGFGGADEQTVASNANSEAYDMSRIAQFAVQATDIPSGTLAVQAQQSFDGGAHWANLGSNTTMVVGDVLRFPITSGPFGLIRYDTTSSASCKLKTVGFPMQWSN